MGIACEYKTFIVCAREIQKSIKESAQKLIADTISKYGLDDQFEITNTEIRHLVTGSRFIFIGLKSNPESVKSLEGAHIVWIEEASQVSEESWEILIPTVRKQGSQIWASWNPDSPSDYVEKLYNPATNPDCVVEHINYTENPFCSPEIIAHAEHMLATEPSKYEWIYLGGYRPQGDMTWIGLSELMPCFGRTTMPDQSKRLVAGLDLGYSKDRSVMVIRQGYIIHQVLVWKNADPVTLGDEVVGLMNKHKIELLGIDALGPGAHMVSQLSRDLGNRVVPVKYSEAARQSNMYTNLRSEAWGHVKEWLTHGCIPSGRDQEWITDLTNIRYSYDNSGRYALESKKLLIARGFPSTDMADALGISLTLGDNKQVVTLSSKRSKSITSAGFSGF